MRNKRTPRLRTSSAASHLPGELFGRELYVAIYESLGEGVVLMKDMHDGYLYRGRLAGRVALKYDRFEDHFCIELDRPIKIVNHEDRGIDIAYVLATPRFEEHIDELLQKRKLFASFSYVPGISSKKRNRNSITSVDMKCTRTYFKWIGIGEIMLEPPKRLFSEAPWGMISEEVNKKAGKIGPARKD